MQGVMPAQAGIHGSKKHRSCIGVGMGSRLRGNDAAVLLPAPYVQQSGTIARTFAPLTGDPYKSLFQRDKWIPAFAGRTLVRQRTGNCLPGLLLLLSNDGLTR